MRLWTRCDANSRRRARNCATLLPPCGRATAAAEAVGDDEFAALIAPLGPFDAARRVVAAVSGGADSMALAVLLARWGRPLAVVVDHGLRPESAGEAELTARRLGQLGIEARVVKAGLAPGSAAAERAREARYALLLQACREAGCADLVLAHHADDQAETVRLRETAGSAAAGLAGMASIAYRAEARLLRPVLGLAPARLRATLAAAGVAHVEDPTNRDPRTGRGRLRAGFTPAERAMALALAAARGRARAERDGAGRVAWAGVRVFPEGFAMVPGDSSAEVLSAVIWTVSGAPYPPPRAALAAGTATRTVHGVMLRPGGRIGADVMVGREPDAVAPAVEARCGAIWDGRFRLLGAAPAGCQIGSLGVDAARLRHRSPLPAFVLRTLPVLRREGAIVAVPALGIGPAETQLAFWPKIPVAGAPFVNLPAGKGAVD